MKITKQKSISSLAIAALVLTGGAYYTITHYAPEHIAHAYVSGSNQDPKIAQDTYTINIPDANLKEALNKLIDTGRQPNQDITFGDIKTANITRIDLNKENGAKDITNLEGLQFFEFAGSQLKEIDIKGQQITSIAPLTDLTTLEGLHIQKTQVADLAPVAKLTNLKDLFIDETPITNIAPIADLVNLEKISLYKVGVSDMNAFGKLTKLTYVSISETDISDISLLANNPNLKTIHLGGAKIYDFTPLAGLANVTELNIGWQRHEVTFAKDNPLLKNPFKNIDGSIIPLVETDHIKNADANGDLNPTGDYIKLVELYGKGSTNTKAKKDDIALNALNDVKLDGDLKINYDLPQKDDVPPVFNPEQPAKIISRKGVALTLNDVTASDNGSGLSPTGITYNHTDIGLNPDSPAKGNYTLTYTVEDNAGNRATVDRQIEITDADALQAKVASVNDAMLRGMTDATAQAVRDKKAAAEAVIARNDAPQSEIDQALNELQQAIDALRAEKRPLTDAITEHDSKPAYIKSDPNVAAKLAEVNRVNGLANPTPADVERAANDLRAALLAAEQAEQQRQTEATDAIAEAKKPGNKSPVYFNSAQAKIDAVKDDARKAALQNELDALKDVYNAKLQELRDLVAKGHDPATSFGMTEASKRALQQAVATAIGPSEDGDGDQDTYDVLIKDLKDALAGLEADKTPLATAEDLHNAQPDYIKNNPAVQSAFRRAQGTRAMPKPPVQDVRDHAKALEDAINAAIQAEEAAQNTAADALTAANDKLNAQLAPNELPAIDFTALEQDIAKVQDPAERTALEQALQDLRTAYAARKKQVDDYNAANPATPLPPVNNQGNTNQNNNANQPAKPADVQAPNTGHQRDTSAGLIAALGGTVAAAAGAAIVALRRKK